MTTDPKPPTWRDRIEAFERFQEWAPPPLPIEEGTRMQWLEEMYLLAQRIAPDRRTEADLWEEAMRHKRVVEALAKVRG